MRLKADLHIHSTHSDGRSSPVEIIYIAQEKGISIVSITDHNTFAGSIAASRLAKSYDVLIVPGVEVRTDIGDVLLYCEKEVDFPRKIGALIDKAHSENCLVVPAHPFDILRIGVGDRVFDFRDWDAIEVWNASASKGSNYKAIEAAKILNKPGLANSDAHIPSEIGSAYSLIETSELSVSSVLEAIRKNMVKPVFGNPSFKIRLNRLLWSVGSSARKITRK